MKKTDSKIVTAYIIFCTASLFSFQLNAQSNKQPPNYSLHSFGLKVSDVDRSVEFYQTLFDVPVLLREKSTVYLGLGNGKEFVSLSPIGEGESPHITHIGIAVKEFDVNSLEKKLTANGLKKSEGVGLDRSGLNAAMSYWASGITNSKSAGKQVISLVDYEGVQFRLLPEDYCVDQNKSPSNCELDNKSNESAPMTLMGINHFTTFVANFERANTFYKKLLGIENHMFQGSFPTLGVGDGYQFLMFVGGVQQGKPTAAASIHHVSLAVKEFDVDKIQSILNGKGLKRVDGGNGTVPALSHYVSLRMPERGGAEGGSPELYFTDPDGLRIQLQDASYCGGGGYLGNECKK